MQIHAFEKNNRKKGLLFVLFFSGKEIVEITAKAGTLKRRQQMRHFLDHMPKDDHDDVFASSPMLNKQIKVFTVD